ncbi:MAG: HEAT repeat domain-containing protein [Thermoguttaceae bacterium]|jgi:HEAT repeat protein|nr:HEAT repeat domain-containing protein [Thermoguttaceae bacterium]
MHLRKSRAGWTCTALLLTAAVLMPFAAAHGGEATEAAAEQVDRWIAELASDNLPQRWHAVYALGQAGPAAADAVEPLMTILANLGGHEYVRGTAAWALGRIGPQAEQAVPLLIETLGSAHISVRRNSPLALAQIGPPAATPAVPQLVGLLNDPDPEVRVSAAVALWHIARHERAIPSLEAMLAGPDTGAYEAAVALGRLDGEPEESVLGALVAAFAHRDATVRRAAARSVGRMGEAALPVLQKALEHGQDEVRRTAAESLGWMGPQAVASLIAALRNDSPAVRCIAARSLGRLGADAALAEPALVAALDDSNPEVRQAVAWAIGRVRREP